MRKQHYCLALHAGKEKKRKEKKLQNMSGN